MKKKPQQLEPDTTEEAVLYRFSAVNAGDVNVEERSIPLVLATETPTRAYDTQRGAIVDEVLELNGMSIPKQVPLLDSHNRESHRSVHGSIRELKVENGKLIGRAYFASDPESVALFNKYADGHITDFSVGARMQQVAYQGKTKRVTRSALVEGSAVTAGADPNCKSMLALRAYSDPEQVRKEVMDAKLKELLITRGLNAEATDNEMLEFVERELAKTKDDPFAKVSLELALEVLRKAQPEAKKEALPTIEEAVKIERKRVADIEEMCRSQNVPDVERVAFITSEKTVQDVAVEILRSRQPGAPVGGARIEGGVSEREKIAAAVGDTMLVRCLHAHNLTPERVTSIAEKAKNVDAIERAADLKGVYDKAKANHSQFAYMGLPDLCRMLCERAGVSVSHLPQQEIVRQALSLDFLARSDAAYHTTGSFPNLMLNAMNKTLRAAYDEFPGTWSRWVRRAPSARDFKQLHRIRFGELPDPEIVPENSQYPDKTTGDSKESYGVEKYGEIFSISLEAIVNDDMNAISRIPQMQGNAMARKVNKVCYAQLTSNPILSDGIALFHASSHGENLDATGLQESSLDTGWFVMGNQKGQTSEVLLNIRPRFLITGLTLAPTAYRLVNGGVVPAQSSNVPLYAAGMPRSLEVIEDANITSATAWYLAADNGTVDTVEICFLQGEEAPVLERENGFTTDTVKYKIRQTFAAKAIDYRGLYQGNA